MLISVRVPSKASSLTELTVTSTDWPSSRDKISASSTLMVTDMVSSAEMVATAVAFSSLWSTLYTLPSSFARTAPSRWMVKSSSRVSSSSALLRSKEV